MKRTSDQAENEHDHNHYGGPRDRAQGGTIGPTETRVMSTRLLAVTE